MIHRIIEMPFAAAIGVLVGLMGAVVGPHLVGSYLAIYDDIFPVLTMSGKIVAVDSDSVTLHITGTKNRGEECRLINIYGYTYNGNPNEPPLDAIAERIDMPATGKSRQKGFYDIGKWRIYPVGADATRAQVWAHHECVGRPILTMIAEVNLKR